MSIERSIPRVLDPILDAAVAPGFTKLGYAIRARAFEPLARMDGRRVVITGATSGIGRAAALGMARLGARVVVVARNPDKLERLSAEIAGIPASQPAETIVADLSLMAEIRDAAHQAAREPVHVLVNNVGVLLPERSETKEGFETTFATDLLGHFVLTEELLPSLRDGAPSRIVNVTSGGMYTQRIDVSDLQNRRSYRGSVAYARAKRGQVILTKLWAERLRDDGIGVHVMHPGWVDTPGVRSSLPTFRRITGPFLRDAEEGADTIVWLASAPASEIGTGGLWHDRRRRPLHRIPMTRETAEERGRLIAALEEYARATGG